MRYKRLGNYIEAVNIRNKDLKIKTLLGVSIKKVLMPSIANTIGTNMKTYKIIKKNQFAYGPVTSRNGDKISIALLEAHEKAIVSQAYTVFKIIDENILLPEYVMMWFRRPEFDRYARFKSHGSARETFDWDELCEVELPIPNIEQQRTIVKEYNTVVHRIELNEAINENLEATAQALYKHWFVDFEFPFDSAQSNADVTSSAVEMPSITKGVGYKSSGGKMVYNEELDKEIPEGWEVWKLIELVRFSKKRIAVSSLGRSNYISTENMLQNKKGIIKSNSLPNAKQVTKFIKDDILISNIRPYFKKIWLAEFEGGCSNDILCFEVLDKKLSSFIYASLEQDIFFEYIMKGAKGTKMPRGDKDWVMNYLVITPDNLLLEKFKEITESFNSLKIKNIKTNNSLTKLSNLLLSKMSKTTTSKATV